MRKAFIKVSLISVLSSILDKALPPFLKIIYIFVP